MGENGVMQNLADSYAFWIFAFGVLVVVYLLPTLIGIVRGVDRLALVFLVNLIGAADRDRVDRGHDSGVRAASATA